MKNKNIFLVIIMIVIASLLLWYGLYSRTGQNYDIPVTPDPSGTDTIQSDDNQKFSESVITAANEYLSANPAESYLLVKTNQSAYSPIPLNEENSFTITQPDGSKNVVHIGKNSFYMESSNCENQNCVEEGEVTLENMNSRILLNMVICLPHQLSLEMLTPEGAKEALLQMYAQQETYYKAMEDYLNSLPENQNNTAEQGTDQ